MSRVFCTLVLLGWVVISAQHVTAQQPGAAVVPGSTVARAAPARIDPSRVLPGTPPGAFSTIVGNALNSTNGSLAAAFVRLRDARTGRIVETQVTDNAGLFAFHSIEPGSYVVEIIDQDQVSILATSQVLNVGAGQAISAVVKLPFRIGPLSGLLGNTLPSAAVVTAQAAGAGVLATQVAGAGTCDSLQ